MQFIKGIGYNSSNRVPLVFVGSLLANHTNQLAHEIGLSLGDFRLLKDKTNMVALEAIVEIMYLHSVHKMINIETRNKYIYRLMNEYKYSEIIKDFLEEYGVNFSGTEDCNLNKQNISEAIKQDYRFPILKIVYSMPKTRYGKKPTKVLNSTVSTTINCLKLSRYYIHTRGKEFDAIVQLYKAINAVPKINDFPSFPNVSCSREKYYTIIEEIKTIIKEANMFYKENKYLPEILEMRLDEYLSNANEILI